MQKSLTATDFRQRLPQLKRFTYYTIIIRAEIIVNDFKRRFAFLNFNQFFFR